MDSRYLAIVPAIVVLVGIFVGFTIRSVVRGMSIPRCWTCGAKKVRKSHSSGMIDGVALAFLLRPYRCEGCRSRFYAPAFLHNRLSRVRWSRRRITPLREPARAHSPARRLQTHNPA